MRIEHVETVVYSLPFREPYVTARGEISEREMVLLRLRTDAGFDGLGEGRNNALLISSAQKRVHRQTQNFARRFF